ncbi:MAG: hypothetical protein UY22_C0017G0009 [Candidatus Amesbacteria bacterium GW2011_GWC1_48_10]|uniref:Uncharacterized protein n=1 Tax=Candidatus Amesbacteria bacterium GW2011_GWC1_48_10 TaxID=1618365 RepID=A0A0G1UHW4_9BACT|nr:MAG: hypothetical protein UY22_C0017G0009 [Candidatus Amesbacteria bacterium GW2011_GWC1_48_10]
MFDAARGEQFDGGHVIRGGQGGTQSYPAMESAVIIYGRIRFLTRNAEGNRRIVDVATCGEITRECESVVDGFDGAPRLTQGPSNVELTVVLDVKEIAGTYKRQDVTGLGMSDDGRTVGNLQVVNFGNFFGDNSLDCFLEGQIKGSSDVQATLFNNF